MRPLLFTLSFLALSGLARQALLATAPPIPVIQEPHHRVALENAYLRTLDVHLVPGEQTLYHSHRLPSVVVELSHSTIASQEWDGPTPATREVAPGETRYAAYDETPLLHQVTNRGGTPFHVMDIELLQPNAEPKDGFPPSLPPPANLLFQKKQVRAYRLVLEPTERLVVPAARAAYLLISYEGALEEKTTGRPVSLHVEAGEETFIAPQSEARLANVSDKPAAAILLELETTD